MWHDDSAHPALVALLEFEEQRLGTPVELRVGHLLDADRALPLRPVVEVLVHTDRSCDSFPIRFDDELMEVSAPIYHYAGCQEIGFRDRQGRICPLAGISGNRLFIYFDLNRLFFEPSRVRRCRRNRNHSASANRIADLIFSQALELVVRNIRRHDWEGEAKAYARAKMVEQDQVVRAWQRDTTVNDRAIEDKTWEIEALARKNAELRDRVKTFNLLTRKRRERQAVEEHENLLRMVGRSIRRLGFSSGKLSVLTNAIGVDYDGVGYEFGCMWIEVPMHGGRIVINPDDSSHTVEGFPHPHVNSDGNPCLGNIGSTVAQLIGEGKLYDCISLLLEFLRSYNPENPYLRIERWDPDWEGEDDRWERCYDNASLSDCATCDDWDCPHREGAESRCYDNAETDDCIACAGCRRHRDAVNSCRSTSDPEDCVTCVQDCTYSGDEEACFTEHDGERCPDCPNDQCEHHPQEEGYEDNDEEHPAHPAAGG